MARRPSLEIDGVVYTNVYEVSYKVYNIFPFGGQFVSKPDIFRYNLSSFCVILSPEAPKTALA